MQPEAGKLLDATLFQQERARLSATGWDVVDFVVSQGDMAHFCKTIRETFALPHGVYDTWDGLADHLFDALMERPRTALFWHRANKADWENFREYCIAVYVLTGACEDVNAQTGSDSSMVVIETSTLWSEIVV